MSSLETCPKCGKKISGSVNFCPNCGTDLETGEKGEKAEQIEEKLRLKKDKQRTEKFKKVGTYLAGALTPPGLLCLYLVFTNPKSHTEPGLFGGEVTVTHPYYDIVKNMGFLLLLIGIAGIAIAIYYRRKEKRIKQKILDLS